MAILKDLIDESSREFPTIPGFWHGKVVDPVPPDQITRMTLVIPDISPDHKWKNCRWPVADVPSLGQDCLVVFSNRDEPWVIALW